MPVFKEHKNMRTISANIFLFLQVLFLSLWKYAILSLLFFLKSFPAPFFYFISVFCTWPIFSLTFKDKMKLSVFFTVWSISTLCMENGRSILRLHFVTMQLQKTESNIIKSFLEMWLFKNTFPTLAVTSSVSISSSLLNHLKWNYRYDDVTSEIVHPVSLKNMDFLLHN